MGEKEKRAGSFVFTRTGDTGTTSLVSGKRVPKTDIQVEVYGTVDELVSAVGVACAAAAPFWPEGAARLRSIQEELMTVAALLASEDLGRSGLLPGLDPGAVDRLEREMVQMTEELPRLDSFILPGGSLGASLLHLCRTVCRRAERRVWELHVERPVPPELLTYLNRLSDWLFMAARSANQRSGIEDVRWQPRR